MASEPVKEINILLMGESGVGKTTFINSCFNYLKYNTLQELLQNELQVLIPAKIHMEDMNYEQKTIPLKVNDHLSEPDYVPNEVLEDGKAATQDVNTYVFSIYVDNVRCKVRFLDTPGMGDERGAEQDKQNCDLILSHLSHLKEIHGFCILLKPLNSRVDVFMSYCIGQIFSRLESSAVKNICFIFTNTRGQNFTAGHTYAPLKVLLQQIKEKNNLTIPLTRENMYCFDNESFRYAAAIKEGIQLQPFIYHATESSWNVSVAEFWRLLTYVSGLPPHDLKKTMSVNDARTMVSNLTEPVHQIVQLIQENIINLKQHTEELSKARLTHDELLAKLNTTQIEIRVNELEYPNMVCVHPDCVSTYMVNGLRKTHYKQKCCTECMLPVKSGIFGNILRVACSAFLLSSTCNVCGHHLTEHKHIFYETEVYETPIDESMRPAVNSNEDLLKLKEKLIRDINERQAEYEHEKRYILQCCANLDRYLQKHSVTPIGNTIENYLNYQITRENAFTHGHADKTVNMLQGLLAELEQERQNVQAGRLGKQDFTPEDVEDMKQKLMKLKHFGPKIQELYKLHQKGTTRTFKKKDKEVKGGVGGFFKQFKSLFAIGSAVAQSGLLSGKKL